MCLSIPLAFVQHSNVCYFRKIYNILTLFLVFLYPRSRLHPSENQQLKFRFLWPCIVSKVWRERKNQQDATIRCLSTSVSTCFGHIMPIFRRTKTVCYCIWCTALVLLVVVGSGCGALLCRTRAVLQQNQRSTPYAVTHDLCSPEDGHNDARNMLRHKLIINIWLLHLVGFFSLFTLNN